MVAQEEGIGIRAARILIAHRNPLAAGEVVELPDLPGRDQRWDGGDGVGWDERGSFGGSGGAGVRGAVCEVGKVLVKKYSLANCPKHLVLA